MEYTQKQKDVIRKYIALNLPDNNQTGNNKNMFLRNIIFSNAELNYDGIVDLICIHYPEQEKTFIDELYN